jgi:hypothetical protein
VGLVVSKIKQNIVHCTKSLFLGGLMTAQEVDPLPLKPMHYLQAHILVFNGLLGNKKLDAHLKTGWI